MTMTEYKTRKKDAWLYMFFCCAMKTIELNCSPSVVASWTSISLSMNGGDRIV